jgi:hypothetical protein
MHHSIIIRWLLPVLCVFTQVISLAANPTIERVEYFIGEDPGRGNATSIAVPPGATTLHSTLRLPAGAVPTSRPAQITVRALDSAGTWSPPNVVRILPAPVDRMAGQHISGIDSWYYALLEGQSVVATGTATRLGDRLTRLDFSSLRPATRYTLILTPVAIGGQLALPKIGKEVDMKSDYGLWQHRHFTPAEQAMPSIAGPLADPTGSGITNGERFIVGIGPDDPGRPVQLVMDDSQAGSTATQSLRFERSKLAALAGFALEQSTDMREWRQTDVIDTAIFASGSAYQSIVMQLPPAPTADAAPTLFRLVFSVAGP